MKYVVIETAFPGDAILSLALATEIKQQDETASITYVVRPDAKELVETCPYVDEVIVYDKRNSNAGLNGVETIAEEINSRKFDVLILLHGSYRSRMLAKALNIPVKIGFQSKTSSTYLTHSVADLQKESRTQRALALLEPLLGNVNYAALSVLHVQGLPLPFKEQGMVVALAPGSAWATKKWGSANFRSLAEQLSAAGRNVVILGGKEDRLFEKDTARIIDLAGKTTLVEAAKALQSSHLLIGNDSALGHVATALRKRSITIYGPTVPEFGFAQPDLLGKNVQLEGLWCRPCTVHGSNECPIYTHECMKGISTERVLELALQ